MPKRNEEGEAGDLTNLMQALLITELARAGVGQVEIRKIAGCGMNRVNQIAKQVERERKRVVKATTLAKIEKKLDTIIRLSGRLGHS